MFRFVPVAGSLSDNAPGYYDPAELVADDSVGPICWKCNGTGSVNRKLVVLECKVCHGSRRLPVKSDVQKGKKAPGSKTKQTLPPGWAPSGPRCRHANTPVEELPTELQLQHGEQMCVFVGDWRIIQRIGGHRWTTDDIVTAWVAGKVAADRADVKYTLDLGCGNGSVLMMVAWQYPEAKCFGMEARSEAVGLARRSIMYNVGSGSGGIGGSGGSAEDGACRVTVANRDFRELIPDANLRDRSGVGIAVKTDSTGEANTESQRSVLTEAFGLSEDVLFDLVTGTPPYFQVDFALKTSPTHTALSSGHRAESASEPHSADAEPTVHPTVERALIRQGGMPTCKESAPARCEFRGGIEAYCAAAAATLAPKGVFVVCENFANHERALLAARNAALHVISIQRVLGKEGKPPLFCVYTMVHATAVDSEVGSTVESKRSGDRGAREDRSADVEEEGVRRVAIAAPKSQSHQEAPACAYHFEEDLVVRDLNGAWTPQYAQLLRDMSYPVASLHPNGSY